MRLNMVFQGRNITYFVILIMSNDFNKELKCAHALLYADDTTIIVTKLLVKIYDL